MAPRAQPLKMGGHQIQGMADGTEDADAVTKSQMDAAIAAIDLSTLAPLASPTFTGDPKAPTPSTADNDTSIATTAYVQANLASYAPKASPALTGVPTAPTASAGNNSTQIATTAYVDAAAKIKFAVKGADQSITSNTSFTDVTDLSFSMTANKIYYITGALIISAGAGGFKFAVNGSTSASKIRASYISSGSYVSAYDTSIHAAPGPSVSVIYQPIIVIENGGSASTFSIRLAQNTSDAANTTVQKSSFIQYVEIA
jgi:hypothetical protein